MPDLTPLSTQLSSDGFIHQKREKKSFFRNQLNRPVKSSVRPSVDHPENFLGIPCKTVVFKLPPKAEREAMRMEFEQGKRSEFIKYLAETQQDALKRAGITQKQMEGMKRGYTPHGFNTHHKVPIYGGGTNDFSNLVLIRREPWHDMLHYHLINGQTKSMVEGESRRVVIPDMNTPVFEPSPQYKFLEKWTKKGLKTYGRNKNISLGDIEREAKSRALMNNLKNRGR